MSDIMNEISVAEILNGNNLIVPEIQREYVWGFNQHGILETFIEDILDSFQHESKIDEDTRYEIKALESLVKKSEGEVKLALTKELNNLKSSSQGQELNIGFLYSYKPNYEITDDGKDLHLIDGQQRFTTLILFLFYFAIKENRKNDFVEVLRFNRKLDKSAFDYRVRNITHDFLIDLIDRVDNLEQLNDIKNQNWFLSNYSEDTTVRAIVGESENNGVFRILNRYFNTKSESFFDFVLNKVRFWHFKTEKTDQGEELYITMNSRGQQLADYENIKAKLFEGISDQLEWSAKWEIWQDFFWKHRAGDSADRGFNEFLRWVVIIRMVNAGEALESVENDKRIDNPIRLIIRNELEKLPIEYLNLQDIEDTFNAVQQLFLSLNKIAIWRDHWKNYDKFDVLDKEWLSGKDGGLSQIQLFRLLPIIVFFKNHAPAYEIDLLDVFRLIRWFFNRSRDSTIRKTADQQILNSIKLINQFNRRTDVVDFLDIEKASTSILTTNEKHKLSILLQNEERVELEQSFWIAEDYEPNENEGGDIEHLISLAEMLSSEKGIGFDQHIFKDVFKCYSEVWDSESAWCDVIDSPMYKHQYDRINCALDWNKNEGLMKLVYERIKDSNVQLKEFLTRIRKEFIMNYKSSKELKDESDYKKQLYIYAILTEEIVEINWLWDSKWNFGIYENGVEECVSLFKTKSIFERYGAQWRYNSGYNHGLWIQDNADQTRDYLEELMEWSKE